MKQVKFLMVALTILMGTMVTSCMDGGNSESSYDGFDYMTITESIYGAGITMKGDFTGVTFFPSNPSALNIGGTGTTKYPERARVYYKFAEGETVATGKKEYKVTIAGCDLVLSVREFCDTDTLGNSIGSKEGSPISQLGDAWGVNGYLNLAFIFSLTKGMTYNHFDMYADKVADGMLYVKFHQNTKEGGSSNNSDGIMSFKIPGRNELMSEFADFPIENDSIKIMITADGQNDSELKIKAPFKVKLNY